MQKKNNFLTKFVKKDYNNRLEEILNGDLFELIDNLIAADQAAKLAKMQED